LEKGYGHLISVLPQLGNTGQKLEVKIEIQYGKTRQKRKTYPKKKSS
jgi:ribosomal protein S28E/S33